MSIGVHHVADEERVELFGTVRTGKSLSVSTAALKSMVKRKPPIWCRHLMMTNGKHPLPNGNKTFPNGSGAVRIDQLFRPSFSIRAACRTAEKLTLFFSAMVLSHEGIVQFLRIALLPYFSA